MKETIDYHEEIINKHSFRLVKLPGGIFDMGEENSPTVLTNTPVHKVALSPFYMAEYLTTQALWKAVMGADHNLSHFNGDLRPVEQVSWNDIVEGHQDQPAFLDRINEWTLSTRPKGWEYRLPTEAEWEYAAKANSPYEYAGSDKLKEVGWYSKNSHGETKEVGLLQANDFGLYDMSGNVREWCMDSSEYPSSYYEECHELGTVKNPLCTVGHNRVCRGGSWFRDAQHCRTSYRYNWLPAFRSSDVGFRFVLASSSAEWSKRV